MTRLAATVLCWMLLSHAGMSGPNRLSDTALSDAMEKGRALMHVEVLSALTIQEERTTFYAYRVAVRALVVPGDLTDADVAQPIDLFAGAAYGDALKVGGSYLLFVTKDAPYSYSWAHRDDIADVTQEDREAVAQLAAQARIVYATTHLREFRDAIEKSVSYSDAIPNAVLSACKRFRSSPKDRCESAREIWESDIGSRRDESRPESSRTVFLPPRVPLSRPEVLDLLGEPDIKVGYCYKWYCGEDTAGNAGVLSVGFMPNGTMATLVYGGERPEHWILGKGSSNNHVQATQ